MKDASLIRHFCLLTAMVLMMLLGACAHRPGSADLRPSEEEPTGAHLSRVEAIEIAKRAAERFGVKWQEYAELKARFRASNINIVWPLMAEGPGEPSFGDHIWVVFFGAGPPMNCPGGHFSVYVDDKTGRSRLAGGL